MSQDLSVITVVYNSQSALDGFSETIPVDAELIVVDNASKDNSVDLISDRANIVIQNNINVGFGAACNQGASAASRDFLLFLNPDVRLQFKSIEELLACAKLYSDAGAIGPLLLYPSGEPNLRTSSPLMGNGITQGDLDSLPSGACCVDYLSGAAFLCRRSAFQDIGGFDEKIFLYFEDDDLCLRLKKQNLSLILCPYSIAIHHESSSTKQTWRTSLLRAAASAHSIRYLAQKHGIPLPKRYRVSTIAKRSILAVLRLDRRLLLNQTGYAAGLFYNPGHTRHENRGILTRRR